MRAPVVVTCRFLNFYLVSLASLFIFVDIVSSHAGCSNRPGTPNEERAVAISDTQINYSWRVTTNGTIFYDMYVTGPNNTDVGKNRTGYGAYNKKFGERADTNFTGLKPNTRYCFSIRSRTEGGTQGCVSQSQSSWQCATTMASAPRPASSPAPLRPPPVAGGSPSRGGGSIGSGPSGPSSGGSPSCSPLGQSCVPDRQSGTHCCKGSPLLCVYQRCQACVPHGEECVPGRTQICCDGKNGDTCVLDQATEKVVCGISG
jgi:hypothetical protein